MGWMGNTGDGARFTVIDTPGFGDRLIEEEKTIESLVQTLRDEIRYINVFVIAFKQTDTRMTYALRSMISLFEKMFGVGFWDNAILEATFWSHGDHAAERRNQSIPMITEAWWAAEFNKKLRQEFSLKKDLQAVFIDTYYKEEDPKELRAFNRNTNELFRFANTSKPFACKDIKIALTEIMELTNSLDQAKEKVREKETYISQIVEERNEFKHQCLPDEKEELRDRERELERQARLLRESRSYRDDVDGKSSLPSKMQENGLERGLGNGHLGLDNSRTHIMRPTSERDIGLHETDF